MDLSFVAQVNNLPNILNIQHKRQKYLSSENAYLSKFNELKDLPYELQRKIILSSGQDPRETIRISKYYHDDLDVLDNYYKDICLDMPISREEITQYFIDIPKGIRKTFKYFVIGTNVYGGVLTYQSSFLYVSKNEDGTFFVSGRDPESDPEFGSDVENADDIYDMIAVNGYVATSNYKVLIPSPNIIRQILRKRSLCIKYDKNYESRYLTNLIKTFILHFVNFPNVVTSFIGVLDYSLKTTFAALINTINTDDDEQLLGIYNLFLEKDIPNLLEIYPTSLY
jgi:hypothetical protein